MSIIRTAILVTIILAVAMAELTVAHAVVGSQRAVLFGSSAIAVAPTTPCVSTGIYNLGNVCNDIYFIGALK